MTFSTSAVAVCCRSASVSSSVRACTSSKRRTFSIAITAWSAKVSTSSICLGVNGPGSNRWSTRIPVSYREAHVPINPHYLALASSIAVGVGAQVLLKVGASGTETATAQFLRVPTIAGLVLYMVSAVLYVVALRKITISVAFPTVSLAYVLIAVIDHFVFKESLGVAQIGGLLLIIAGVTLLNVSA